MSSPSSPAILGGFSVSQVWHVSSSSTEEQISIEILCRVLSGQVLCFHQAICFITIYVLWSVSKCFIFFSLFQHHSFNIILFLTVLLLLLMMFLTWSNLNWVWCTWLKQPHPGPQQSAEQWVCSRHQFQSKAEVSKHHPLPQIEQHTKAQHLPRYIHIEFAHFVSLYSKGKKYEEYHNFAFLHTKICTLAASSQSDLRLTSAMAASVLVQFHHSPQNDNTPMIKNPRIHLGRSMLDRSTGAECEWRRSCRYLGRHQDQVNLSSQPGLMILCC